MTDRSRSVLRGIPTVVASMHAFTQEREARARSAGNHFWERGNPHYALAPIVESRLIDTLGILLGGDSARIDHGERPIACGDPASGRSCRRHARRHRARGHGGWESARRLSGRRRQLSGWRFASG